MKSKTMTIALLLAALSIAQADEHRSERSNRRHEHHNYIIERQQAYQVQGVPTSRLIIGKREIDIYPNGQMFEGNHLVGIKGGR
jgi:hypothetical protein